VTSAAMTDLLKIASAKFIMSLTGLFCSIVFTVVFRILFGSLDRAIHGLCGSLEKRLAFISLEAIAVEQLSAVKEQREHFRLIGMELVAELGRPLREELPLAISNSIRGAMAPLMEQVGKMGTDGVEGMVKNLSSQFADDVSRSLSQASERLAEAGQQIKILAERMDQSSGRMGAEMETSIARVAQAVETLSTSMAATAATTESAFSRGAEHLLGVMNETLQGIRDNTGEGSRAMSAAAGEMRGAAEGFRSELESASRMGAEAAQARMLVASEEASGAIGSAGNGVLEAFGRTSAEINRVTNELTEKAGAELLAPLGNIAEKLGSIVSAIAKGSVEMHRMSEGVRAGADASAQAATTFRTASKDLTDTAVPIRATTERMEASLRSLAETTHNVSTTVSQSAQSTARSAADALDAAQKVLGIETERMQKTMAGIDRMLEQLKGQGDRLDEMDTKLGSAFESYTKYVKTSVDAMFSHVRELQGKMAPALDTMRDIMDQVEHFAPQSRST
jgi:methyl-accepting chemotaxis protein